MIDVVSAYRGDIVKFCGDSVMISWTVESADHDESEEEAALSSAMELALGCALRLTESCRLCIGFAITTEAACNCTTQDNVEEEKEEEARREDYVLRLHCKRTPFAVLR